MLIMWKLHEKDWFGNAGCRKVKNKVVVIIVGQILRFQGMLEIHTLWLTKACGEPETTIASSELKDRLL